MSYDAPTFMSAAEIARLLVEKNLEMATTIADTSMLWWVSSVVFCGSLLGGFWLQRDQINIVSPFALHWICGVVAVFFLSFIAYPVWVIYSLRELEKQTSMILAAQVPKSPTPLIFGQITAALLIGTVTFVLIFLTWLGMWWHLARRRSGGATPLSR